MSEIKEVTIYTDGASVGNPGPGGYGVILLYANHRKEISGGFQYTTNNRMEIFAAIIGLEALKTRCKVTLYSDSQYPVNGIEEGWAKKWQQNGWWRTKSEKALNSDLWKRLLELYNQHEVKFVWIKGHANNAENEQCDRLSYLAAGRSDLPTDENYKPDLQYQGKIKITQEGQPCRKCSTPVIKKIPHRKDQKKKAYTYSYYFYCPACNTIYMPEEAKEEAQTNQGQDSKGKDETPSLFDLIQDKTIVEVSSEKSNQAESQEAAETKVDEPLHQTALEAGKVVIYTNGDCIAKTGCGGYGAILLYKNQRKETSAGFALTTNPRMELMSCIVCLKAIKQRMSIILYTNLQYVVDGVQKGWAKKWQANNWKRRAEGSIVNVKNADLWQMLLKLCDYHQVEFVWLKRNAKHPETIRCKELATVAMNKSELRTDKVFEENYKRELTGDE